MNKIELATLKARVDNDDPEALLMYSDYLLAQDPQESDKYLVLAAQLGNPQAAEKLGDKYIDKGDYARAAEYFKIGAKAGILDCSVKLAVTNLSVNETAAVRELEDLAESGVKSACSALAAYYKAHGNRKQASFWRSLLK
ncbi:MAG: hypothetical protein J1G01_07070 [Clostridiales bacterium]|nr:hypothetical protein [Clostridiales bacterium]